MSQDSAALEEFGNQFVKWYYNKFNQVKEDIIPLYRPESLVTFQENMITGLMPNGRLSIEDKILSESLKYMMKSPTTWTIQPSISNTVLICVQGTCKMTPEEAEELGFFENFIIGMEEGNFVILNQIFSTSSV
ncbi:nuclear transport factor 2, putative [Trichomonas vaginalis G3]|uniref:NTF2-related export protein n=1 Tax=Trichomonas vaginalis (strain ATCC PRA-98 / G3) TaxID=412133 RepID=A2F775_TRIV3|nr:NTF2-like family [Trichomonas vaginalis G3]EAX99242.1 nuclear transport factor 2, putative [Trichomonas vaginalis G3]KAI5547939.1 NTF2-like family [Trichomonas vaginalis G3]|eukprot:XP_001312172.1 nuclear transport factor 2 [Trichomonas vaginalis G3]